MQKAYALLTAPTTFDCFGILTRTQHMLSVCVYMVAVAIAVAVAVAEVMHATQYTHSPLQLCAQVHT